MKITKKQLKEIIMKEGGIRGRRLDLDKVILILVNIADARRQAEEEGASDSLIGTLMDIEGAVDDLIEIEEESVVEDIVNKYR